VLLGKSKVAATNAIRDGLIVRACLRTSSFTVPLLYMWMRYRHNLRQNIYLECAAIFVSLLVGVPFSHALFEQKVKLNGNLLEKEFAR